MEKLALTTAELPAPHFQRLQALQTERQALLQLSATEVMARILDAPQPAALVHSYAAQDLYMLVHDVGPDDALPLLALASERQIEHILDRELWFRDQLSYHSITAWLQRLYLADPQRTLRWVLEKQPALLEVWLFRNVRLYIREHDQDPSDFPHEAFTFDDVFYVELVAQADRSDDQEERQHQRDYFLSRFLEDLAIYDYAAYQQILFNAAHVLPAEAEEEAYYLRNRRLEEMGFLPFESALRIYQPLRIADLRAQRRPKRFIQRAEQLSPGPSPPLYTTHLLDTTNLFGRALARIDNDAVRQQIQLEFAGLANQLAMADQQPIHSREQLRQVVAKACGYLNIGLESVAIQDRRIHLNRAIACVQRHGLVDLFRVGYGKALTLKWKARKWVKTSWFRRQKLGLSFWDEDGMGRIGGMMLKKPLFYDAYQAGRRFREFTCLHDIIVTRNALQRLMNLDAVLSRLTFEWPPSHPEILPTFKNTLLTLWAQHYLGLSTAHLQPLAVSDLRRFVKDLFGPQSDRPDRPGQPGQPDRAGQFEMAAGVVSMEMRENCLGWLADSAHLTTAELSHLLAPVLETLFTELEQELGSVSIHALDSRYIQLFMAARD